MKKNGKYIYVDSSSFANVNSLEFDFCRRHSDGLAAIKVDKKWGYVDVNGEIVIQPIYDDCKDFSEGLAAVKISDKWGFIDIENKLKIPTIYDEVSSFDKGLAEVSTLNSKSNDRELNYGLINKNGIQIIPCIYSTIYCKNDGFYGIGFIENETNYTLGFCNNNGKIISSPEYNDIKLVNNIDGHDVDAVIVFGQQQAFKSLNNNQLLNKNVIQGRWSC